MLIHRLRECKRRNTIERDQWASPGSGLPGCQPSCGPFVTMQCDSNGDGVLGAMSLMMNSSTTIITLSKCLHTYTGAHKTTTTSPPTHTHADTTSPQPLQRSPTYIWCWREQGLRLAQASQPKADSEECSCSVWHVWMEERSALSAETNAPSFVRYIQICTQVHPVTWTGTCR